VAAFDEKGTDIGIAAGDPRNPPVEIVLLADRHSGDHIIVVNARAIRHLIEPFRLLGGQKAVPGKINTQEEKPPVDYRATQ